MKRLLIFIICSITFLSCSNKDGTSHIEFLSVPVDGPVKEYLNKIQTETSSSKGCFSDNLGLTVDTINFEKEFFGCGNHERIDSPTYFWIAFEAYWDEDTKKVMFLQGKSVIGWESLEVLKIKLFESLGQATYTGRTIDAKTRNSWSEIEKSLFEDMSKNFIAWDCGNGYVIIDFESREDARSEDGSLLFMYIVDRENYWESFQAS